MGMLMCNFLRSSVSSLDWEGVFRLRCYDDIISISRSVNYALTITIITELTWYNGQLIGDKELVPVTSEEEKR